MTKQFEVTVMSQSIEIREAHNLTMFHFLAIVDGERHEYRIVNGRFSAKPATKTAFGRGSVAAHYHAKNQGSYVRFEPVGRISSKKKKISPKQMIMFGDTHEYS